MALPKEPRQKMINLMYLVLTALLALNVSSEILNAFKVVDRSLIISNDNFAKSTRQALDFINTSKTEPGKQQKALEWEPRAIKIQSLSKEMYDYIDDLKKQLKKEAGADGKEKNEDGTEKFKEDDLEAATRLFSSEGTGKKKGEELLKKLKEYKSAILSVHPEVSKFFGGGKDFPITVEDKVKGSDGKEKKFEDAYFHMTPTIAALTLLSKFQNDIRNTENKAVTFCAEQLGKVEFKFDKFAAIVGQSSNYLMPDDELEIMAGLGAFSSEKKPTITIDGQQIPVNDEGKAILKKKVQGAGDQVVKVRVSFKDQDNKDQVKEFDVKYTVGTPGGASCAAIKMNVFYVGVENPIVVGSSTGMDKTQISVSGAGATMTGTGSKRSIRVTQPDAQATVTVTAEGKKPEQFVFRTKSIPDPVFRIGEGKPRIATVDFKNQDYCRADLDKFDFDLTFQVVSAKVYFSGAGFSNYREARISSNSLSEIKNLMNMCQPGSTITFENIRVKGPDGERGIDGRSFTLY